MSLWRSDVVVLLSKICQRLVPGAARRHSTIFVSSARPGHGDTLLQPTLRYTHIRTTLGKAEVLVVGLDRPRRAANTVLAHPGAVLATHDAGRGAEHIISQDEPTLVHATIACLRPAPQSASLPDRRSPPEQIFSRKDQRGVQRIGYELGGVCRGVRSACRSRLW